MRKLKNYISDEDRFLKTFDHAHPELSDSQQVEVDKHARLAKMRDEAADPEAQSSIWEDF